MNKQALVELSIEYVSEMLERMEEYQSDYDDAFYLAQEYAQQLLDELESISESD